MGHWRGDLRFLDRAEGALTDLRLLARGERPAPDLVTIVAIDDDTVAKKGGYPLPRADLAAHRRGDRPLRAPRRRARPAAGRSRQRRPATRRWRGRSTNVPPSSPRRRSSRKRCRSVDAGEHGSAGAPAAGREIPAAAQGIRRSGRRRRRQSDHRQVRHAARRSDAVSNRPTRLNCRSRCAPRHWPTGSEPTIEADGLLLGERHIPTDIDHVLPLAFYGRHGTVRTISAASLLNGDVAARRHSRTASS